MACDFLRKFKYNDCHILHVSSSYLHLCTGMYFVMKHSTNFNIITSLCNYLVPYLDVVHLPKMWNINFNQDFQSFNYMCFYTYVYFIVRVCCWYHFWNRYLEKNESSFARTVFCWWISTIYDDDGLIYYIYLLIYFFIKYFLDVDLIFTIY